MTETNETTEARDDGADWMLIEIFGHRRHAGRVREEERFGAKMCRIDVPKVEWQPGETEGRLEPKVVGWTTHWYGGSSIFSVTPTDEASAMRIEAGYPPPARYQLPAPSEDEDDPEEPNF